MMELREFDFEPFNTDQNVSSLDQFLSYINKEDIFGSLPGIGNVIASDVILAVSYLHSRNIVHRDINPANVLVFNSHYKSYKHKELEMAFGKKPIVCKLTDLEEARSMYTQSKNGATVAHTGSSAFIAPELIIEELSIASAGTDELKTVDVWVVSMTFFKILNPNQSYPFQNDSKNIPNKVNSNMEAACKQELQK